MTKTVANRDLPRLVRNAPDFEAEGYGALSYTPRGYHTGYLPTRLQALFNRLTRQNAVPTIYSYGTPIAWLDREHGVWVRPYVGYSVTTAKHQGYLYQLSGTDWRGGTPGAFETVEIPWDCDADLYKRIVSGQTIWTRGRTLNTGTTWPGPNFILN